MGKLTEIEGHHQQMGEPSIQTVPPPSCAILPIAGHWQVLLLSDLVFCANELCSSGGEYLGGGLPGLFTLVTIVWHLISLLVAACVCFAPPPIQSKHTIACDQTILEKGGSQCQDLSHIV